MDYFSHIPDYELLRRIGAGSYGDVWLARSVTGVYRAIKIVDRARFSDERPFLREFDGIARFQQTMAHEPTQLALLHVARDDSAGILYYVMELADDAVAGTDIVPATYVPLTLKEVRIRRNSLPVEECLRIGVELATALDNLHTAGLIHRDVKPSNIIFVNKLAKLADVGLIASSGGTLTSIGTPGYAPPEGSGSRSADLYSLGKILYELCTGLDPSEFPRVPPAFAMGPTGSRFLELNEIILRACDPEAPKRYDTARAMLDELLLLQAGRSVKELNRIRRRLRLLARVGIVAAIASAVVVGVLATKNYFAMKRIAAQEVALGAQARANEKFAQYVSNLHRAQLAYSWGDYGSARAALRNEIPRPGDADARGFEWHALWGETAGDPCEVIGAVGAPPVSRVLLSPDGRNFATLEGAPHGSLTSTDLKTGARRLLAHEVYRLGNYGAGGGHLVVELSDRKIYEIDAGSGQISAPYPCAGYLLFVADQGNRLLLDSTFAQDGSLWVAEARTGRKLAEWTFTGSTSPPSLSAAALSGDGRYLAAAVFWADGMLRKRAVVLYDLEQKREVFRTTRYRRVQEIQFSHDSSKLALALFGTVAILDGAGRELAMLAGHSAALQCVEFSLDDRRLVAGGQDQSTLAWNVSTGEVIGAYRGHEGDVKTLAWLQGNDEFLSGSGDGTVRRWRIAEGKEGAVLPKIWNDQYGDFVFSRSGKLMATTTREGEVAVHESESRRRTIVLKGVFQPIAFSDDDKELFTITAERKLVRCRLDGGMIQTSGREIENAKNLKAIIPAEQRPLVALAFVDRRIEVWDLKAEKRKQAIQTSLAQIEALAWDCGATRLAIGDRFGKVAIYSVENGKLDTELPPLPSAIWALAFSPDDRKLLAGRDDGHISVWNLQTKQWEFEATAHSARVQSIAFAPKGDRFVTVASDGIVQFWTADPYRPIALLPWFTQSEAPLSHTIWSAKFDPTGKYLGVWTDEGVLKTWRRSDL